jgi:hypothetical protein
VNVAQTDASPQVIASAIGSELNRVLGDVPTLAG